MDKKSRLKEETYIANMELKNKGLVIYTFGNVSQIDRELGLIAIKPSGVEYEILTPDDMVLLDLSGRVIEGKLNPSSDTRTHLVLYNKYPKIGGIVHTHSKYATAFAQANLSIKCLGTTHADYFYSDIPCTEVINDKMLAGDYEEETGNLIISRFERENIDYLNMKACLVACHGPFTWGKDAIDAVFTSVLLEEIANMNYLTQTLNPEIKSMKKALLDKHYFRKHGSNAYYGQGQ